MPSRCVQSYPQGPDAPPQQACVTRLGLHRTLEQGGSNGIIIGHGQGQPVNPELGGPILTAVVGGLVGAALVGTVLLVMNP